MINSSAYTSAAVVIRYEDILGDYLGNNGSDEDIARARRLVKRSYRDLAIHFDGVLSEEELSAKAWELMVGRV